MPDQQHRSRGTQPPPPQPLLRDLPHANTHAVAGLPDSATIGVGTGAPSLRIHPSAGPNTQRNLGWNPRRVRAPVPASQHFGGGGGQVNAEVGRAGISRRMSSEDSGETEQSEPSKWFDQSNENPARSFGPRGMDVDTPYFQKESDSSNGELSKDTSTNYPFPSHPVPPPLKPAVSTSSAEDYRSVIDDLTIEIKRLKEELRRYKGNVPDTLKKDAMFEVRVHGLNKRKKRELEQALREFAMSVSGSPRASSQRQTTNTPSSRAYRTFGSSGVGSKHTSSTGNPRIPADSAYASMSNAGNSTNPTPNEPSSNSLLLAGRPNLSGRARTTEQKVQLYLDGVPEGLFPRYVVMTEKEKKKLVVKRLEKIFTGKMGGHRQGVGNGEPQRLPPLTDEPSQARCTMSLPNALGTPDATREARILTVDSSSHKRAGIFRDNGSTSASVGDQTDSRGAGSGSGGSGSRNGNGSGNGSGRSSRRGMQTSPVANVVKHEQRPTRPHDLDPDRIQPPSENMDYFRHLGLAPPSNLSDTVFSANDVAPDTDGWVWLNLICNLAQIHILNVTPNFIRKAVSERSTRLQISPDRQKIRWRGGTEGTKFSSDSSGENNKSNGSTDEEGARTSGGQRKKIKTQHFPQSVTDTPGTGSCSDRNKLRFTPQVYNSSSSSFHYKPMFVHQESSLEQTSDEGLSQMSLGCGVDSNGNSNSRWDYSGAGLSFGPGRRRVDGSITYYHGAPFCTDLSRDSPNDLMFSSSQELSPGSSSPLRPGTKRTISGSSLPTRFLSVRHKTPAASGSRFGNPAVCASSQDLMQVDEEEHVGNMSSDSDEDEDEDSIFPWGDSPEMPQKPRIEKLEAIGLGGVTAADHFLVYVVTRRSKFTKSRQRSTRAHSIGSRRHVSEDATDTIISRIAEMTTVSPAPPMRTPSRNGNLVEVKHVSGQVKKLEPSPLPPPATFIPPFSSDDEDEDDMDIDFGDDCGEFSGLGRPADSTDKEELLSRLANPHLSDNTPEDAELSSGDEEDEVDPEAEACEDASGSSSSALVANIHVDRAGSSAATAGGGMESAPSEYDSSEDEEDGEDVAMD